MIESDCVAVGIVAFVGGMAVPFRYGMERIRGFGRYVANRLPQG